jgi:hypothetical protein
MPFFEIAINGAKDSCAGGHDCDAICAHVIVSEDPEGSFSVHGGSRRADGTFGHVEWVSKAIRLGDEVELAYLLNGDTPMPISHFEGKLPVLKPLGNSADLVAELNRTIEELKSLSTATVQTPLSRSPLMRSLRPRALQISINSGQVVEALLGDEDQLQAVMNFDPGKCSLEVDAISTLEGGYTKGRQWLSKELQPGDRVRIKFLS